MSIRAVNNELERSGVGLGIRKVAQWVSYSDFTDGGGTDGTLDLTDTIPAGSFIFGTKVKVVTGFTGDTSCVLDIGDGSDPDLFTYTNHNIFTASDNLVEGCDSSSGGTAGTGIVPVTSATTITLTATSDNDWGDVSAGRMLVEVFYFSTNVEAQDNYPYRYKYSS